MDNYLEMKDINKTFSGNKVLHHIDFGLKLGEIRALMGENGAGKSTLMKILGGIYPKDKNTGQIFIDGKAVEINSVEDAKKYGIAIVHQEISLVNEMTVYDNLFMGDELSTGSGLFLDDREMIRRAQEIIDELKVNIHVQRKVKSLSIAQQQMVEICRALLFNAKIIVMDEPTSSLTGREIDELFSQLQRLKSAGLGIIYISHRMEEIFRISDSITILRDGRLIGTKPMSGLDHDSVIQMMVGRDLDKYIRHSESLCPGNVCLTVKHLSNQKIHDISFDLRAGEVLGFAGLVGAGRSETARAIFGIDPVQEGEIFIDQKRVSIKNAADAIRSGIGYVPENRKEEGLILDNTVAFNLTISILEQFIHWIHVDKAREHKTIGEYSNKLSIKMSSPDQRIKYLSGGNQQKVVVSKWLATHPRILILDEPTRGIDIGAKTEIYHLIVEMARSGVAVILISSEMEEILSLCSRVVVMYEGKVTAVLDEEETENVTQEEIMWYASGRVKNEAE